MKKLILIAALSCFVVSGFSQTNTTDKSLAKVEQLITKKGVIFIFVKSKPANEYDILGKVNMPEIAWSGKANEMIKSAANRCLKQFPKAEGVIISGKNLGSAIAIKFK